MPIYLFLSHQNHTAFSIKLKVFLKKQCKNLLKILLFSLNWVEFKKWISRGTKCYEVWRFTYLTLHAALMWLKFHSKSWLNYNYGLWLRKLVVRWTKQQDKPLRVKFSVVDVPNMVIQIRERFNIFGMLYQKTQPCPYPFHLVTRSNSKQLPKVVSLYILSNQNT